MALATPEDLKRWQGRTTKEQRDHNKRKLKELSVIDLRDQAVSLIRNRFGDHYEEVHDRDGPIPQTIKNWETDKVKSPRMQTLRAALRTVGKDLGIIDYRG